MAARDGRPCSCGNIVYIGYNWNEPYPSRWDKVLLQSVELLNPCWAPPPPLPPLDPCSDPPKPNCAASSIPSCPSTGWSGQGSKKQVTSGEATAQRSPILAAVSQEQSQIADLTNEVQQLMSVQNDRETEHSGDALSSLKSKVSEVLERLDGRRQEHHNAHSGTEVVLEKSMATLAGDVSQVDNKVDKLASAVDKLVRRRRGRHEE
mmetsp:Transcript_63422/g.169631  ORF Transcript_63422/g.169631 Transcript_63422/m.169631 type:complete len:206 (-) Transcript_63422:174-791(-)